MSDANHDLPCNFWTLHINNWLVKDIELDNTLILMLNTFPHQFDFVDFFTSLSYCILVVLKQTGSL